MKARWSIEQTTGDSGDLGFISDSGPTLLGYLGLLHPCSGPWGPQWVQQEEPQSLGSCVWEHTI